MSAELSIVVVLGGPGAEREVSLDSGAAVARALRSLGHEVTEIDPVDGTFALPDQTDLVFLALHGTFGEDGQIQQELENMGVAYTGCGVEASRVAFDKALTKLKCIEAEVPTPRFEIIKSVTAEFPVGWRLPAVLKPVCQGSSVGLRFVESIGEWQTGLAETLKHGARAILEEVIVGAECTVGILAGEALPIVEVRPKGGIYDYATKYTSGSAEYLCPAPFEPVLTQAVQEAGLKAFQAVGGRDYGRVDVMVSQEGKPFVLEVNTLPGMTETSLLPKAANAVGLSYADLCQRMVDLALLRRSGENSIPAVANSDDSAVR